MNTIKMKTTALIGATAFVVVALVCWISPRKSNILQHTASTLAASLANAKVNSDYGVKPFSAADGRIEISGDQWTWTATKGYGHMDLQAKISCKIAQTEPRVEVSKIINMQW